jgi:hypothetical protein
MRRVESWAPVLFVSAFSLSGCGSAGEAPDADALVTITQGVYGELGNGCDTPDCTPSASSGRTVDLLAEAPMNGMTPAILKSTQSDGTGFYQLEVDPGTYFLSIGEGVNGTEVTVPKGLVRCDWESGPGGGFWSCVNK